MKLSTTSTSIILSSLAVAGAFAPSCPAFSRRSLVVLKGYLDDLSNLRNAPEETEDDRDNAAERVKAKNEAADRYGPSKWEDFVEFNEFDGGDGQMGVAGDGEQGLNKKQFAEKSFAKSRDRSAKNAWGSSSGYAEELRAKGVETSRAQQLENWHQQQEVLAEGRKVRQIEESYNKIAEDAEQDWRSLAKFGIERVEDFDYDEVFGPVVPSEDIEETVQLRARIGSVSTFEFSQKNPYMGFADFRAAILAERPSDWGVSPSEGSLTKTPVDFIVRFRPNSPGSSQAFLVLETEDFKKTWKLVGTTA